MSLATSACARLVARRARKGWPHPRTAPRSARGGLHRRREAQAHLRQGQQRWRAADHRHLVLLDGTGRLAAQDSCGGAGAGDERVRKTQGQLHRGFIQ
eukprot:4821188-Prymnesium_polylepis.1